jgi:membrane protease YdiL (CAAX protease family)
MPYARHAAYFAPALRRPELWRTALGLLLVISLYAGCLAAGYVLLTLRYGEWMAAGIVYAMANGATPGSMLLLLASFFFIGIGPIIAVRLLHRRRAGTLFGPDSRRVLADFARVVAPILGLNLLLLPLYLSDPAITSHQPIVQTLAYLPFALPLVLLQTGAEELLFRGYLQQQLAARFHSPVVWMGLPSALFAALHYAPQDYGGNAFYIVVWTFAFGLFAADLTARTGHLGAAIGLHFANNLAAMLLVAIKGDLDGLALWTIDVSLTDPAAVLPILVTDFLGMFIAWLLARLALRL